jgi:lysophospholipase L1-like esterase
MSTFSHTAKYHIALLGDSTLDNVVWVPSSELAVSPQLKHLLQKKDPSGVGCIRVTNYAADGFTSSNVLEGGAPCLSYRARIDAGEPFPASITGPSTEFHPLEDLQKLSTTTTITHTVVSVGGNDIRHILQDMSSLPRVVSTFQANYQQIIARVQSICARPIIVLQYRPSFAQEWEGYGVYNAMDTIPGLGSSVDKINHLMQHIYQPILHIAREHSLPIIDLPNSFDIHKSELYSCQIEPSGLGSKYIAHLISHVVANHDYHGCSKIYSTSTSTDDLEEVVEVENNELLEWAVYL